MHARTRMQRPVPAPGWWLVLVLTPNDGGRFRCSSHACMWWLDRRANRRALGSDTAQPKSEAEDSWGIVVTTALSKDVEEESSCRGKHTLYMFYSQSLSGSAYLLG
jgi:hypothetical protein